MFGDQLPRTEMATRTALPSDRSRSRLHSFLCRLRSLALSGQRSELDLQLQVMETKWAHFKNSYDISTKDRMEVADQYFAALEVKLFSLCLEHKAVDQSRNLITAMLNTIPFTSDPAKTSIVQQAMEAWMKAVLEEDSVQDHGLYIVRVQDLVTQLTEQTGRQGDLLQEPCREKALLHHVRFLLLAKVLENQPKPEVKHDMMDAADDAEDLYLMEPDLEENDRRQCLRLLLLPRVLVTLGLSPEGVELRLGTPVTSEDIAAAASLLEKVRGFGQTENLWCRMLEELGWSWLCHYRNDPHQASLHAREARECADSGGFQTEKGAIFAHLHRLSGISTAQSPPSGLLSSTFQAKLEIRSGTYEENFSLSRTDSQECVISVPDEIISPEISDCSATSPKSTVEPRSNEVGSTLTNYSVPMNDERVLSHSGSETSVKETPPDDRRPRSTVGQEAQDYTSSTSLKGIVEPSSNETLSSLTSIHVHREASLQQPLGHTQTAPDSASWNGTPAERGDNFSIYSPATTPGRLTPSDGDLSSWFVAKLEIRSEITEENFYRSENDSQHCLISLPSDVSATIPKSTSSDYSVAMNDDRVLSHFSSETTMTATPGGGGLSQNPHGREAQDFLSSTSMKMAVEPSNNEMMSPPKSILVHREASLHQPLGFAQTARNDTSWDANAARTRASFPHYTIHPSPAPTADRQTPRGGELSSTFVAKLETRSDATEENILLPEIDPQGCRPSVQSEVSNQEVLDISVTSAKSTVESRSNKVVSTSPDCSVAKCHERVLSYASSETPMKEASAGGELSQNVHGRETQDVLSSGFMTKTIEPSSKEIMSPPKSILVHRDASLQQPLGHAQSSRDDASWNPNEARTRASFQHLTIHPRPAPTADRQTPRGGELSSTFAAKLETRSDATEENLPRPEIDTQGCPLSVEGEVSNPEVWDISATVPKAAVKPKSGEAASTSPVSLGSDPQHENSGYKRVVPGRTSMRATQGASETKTNCQERAFPIGSSRQPNRGDAAPMRNVDKMLIKPATEPSGYNDGSSGVVYQTTQMSTDSGFYHSSTSTMDAYEKTFCTGSDTQDHSLTQCKQAVERSRDFSNDFSDDSITECKKAFQSPCHTHESGNTTRPGACLPDDSCTRRKLLLEPHSYQDVSREHTVQLTGASTGSPRAEYRWHRGGFDDVSDHIADQSCTERKQLVDSSFSPRGPPGDCRGHHVGFSDDSVTRGKLRSGSLDSAVSSTSSRSGRRKGKKSGFSLELPKSFYDF